MADVGRPGLEVTSEMIEKVESYASLGLKKYQIADALGIHIDTLIQKGKKYPELNEALKRGKAKGIAHYANMLIKKAENGSVPSIIFFLKTKGGFIEKSQVKHIDARDEKEKIDQSKERARERLKEKKDA
jgi:hypothetical protein